MLNIAICDDDENLCTQLEESLLHFEKREKGSFDVDIFYRGEMLFRALDSGEKYDIIFLDIELISMSGIEIGHNIRKIRGDNETQIIYISGNDSYALELFKIRPLDFLVKPIKYEDVEEALHIAVRLLRLKNKYFEFSEHRRALRIPISEILYFESRGKKVQMVVVDGTHEFYSRMIEVTKQISSHDFFEIHNSYLIHYNHVIESGYDYVVMTNNVKLPISRNHRKNVRDWLLKRKDQNEYER